MLTNEDIKNIIDANKQTFATKEDFELLRKEANKISIGVINNGEEVKSLKEGIEELKEVNQSLVSSIDKLVKAVSDLREEYSSISSQISRHEKWLHLVAEKIGIKLEY